MSNSPGKIFIFEGLDGSGKSTQTKLLSKKLNKEGYKTKRIDFPQYGTKSAGLIEEYLNGKYGSSKEVGPYRASIFYACDRYDASFKIKDWLSKGNIVISDRYIASNIGHQGGKIKDIEKWKKYVKWLYDFEYNFFQIPRPDYTFILKTAPAFSLKLANRITDKEKIKKRRAYLGDDKKQDLHEKDKEHLSDTLRSYLNAAKEFPEEFKVIECIENENLLPPEKIHLKVWDIIKEKL